MLTKILIAIAAIVVVFAVVVALQPSPFQVARSIRISAPPAAVFAQVMIFTNGKHGTRGERSIRQ